MYETECFGAGCECMGPSNRMYQRGWMYGGLRSVMLRYAPHLSSYSQPGWVARVECGNPGADRDTGQVIQGHWEEHFQHPSVWDTTKVVWDTRRKRCQGWIWRIGGPKLTVPHILLDMRIFWHYLWKTTHFSALTEREVHFRISELWDCHFLPSFHFFICRSLVCCV